MSSPCPARNRRRFSAICAAALCGTAMLARCGVIVTCSSPQKGMLRRQRLGPEHVEGRAADLAVPDRRDQRVVIDQLAAPDIDHPGAARQRVKDVAADDPVGLGRERHHQHEDLAAREEVLQLPGAMEAGDAVHRLGRARPARHLEALAQQLRRRESAEMAEPHDADRGRRRLARMDVVPAPLALRLLEGGEVAVVAQHRQQHVLRHHPVHLRIDEAHDRDRRRQGRVLEDVVDAGADIHDQLEIRVFPHLAGRRLPHQRAFDLGRVAGLGPDAEVEARHRPPQAVAPVLRIVELAVEQHGARAGHFVFASARSSRRCIASSANS